MEHTVLTSSFDGLPAGDRTGMFRLRYEVFHERLGWRVSVTPDGLEKDGFDQLESVRYIIAKSPEERIDACWRLLPSLGPTMLRDVFPELLHGQAAPCAADVWELSRFAIASDRLAPSEGAGNHQLGFGELSVALMAESTRFAQDHGIARYVTVTTTAIERLLRKQGVNVYRVGPPVRIGDVYAVACFIEIDGQTLRALGR